jgi:hypothetical protein
VAERGFGGVVVWGKEATVGGVSGGVGRGSHRMRLADPLANV